MTEPCDQSHWENHIKYCEISQSNESGFNISVVKIGEQGLDLPNISCLKALYMSLISYSYNEAPICFTFEH